MDTQTDPDAGDFHSALLLFSCQGPDHGKAKKQSVLGLNPVGIPVHRFLNAELGYP
jgi:hypothetical protein